MIIAVSSSGRDLNSQIDPRFGRCAFFIIYNTDDGSVEVFDNENIALGGGAGIQSAQFIAAKGAKAIITGNCGPNAVKTLTAAGIQLFLGQSGTVRDGIDKFQNNTINPSQEANVSDHFGMKGGIPSPPPSAVNIGTDWTPGRGGGMGRGGGRGMGMGGGRGMGVCGGKGMGQGMRRGMGLGYGLDRIPGTSEKVTLAQPVQGNLSRDQELILLKDQSKELQRQMDDIQARISKLDENS